MDFWILAESEEYEWIVYLVIVFFMFIIPILKKAVEAVTGKKEKPVRRPGSQGGEAKERGAVQEMLDEVEDFFRKGRTGTTHEKELKPKKRREITHFDDWYAQRKEEIEERRQKREEKRRQKQVKSKPVVSEPASQSKEITSISSRQFETTIGDRKQDLGTMKEVFTEPALPGIAREKPRVSIREESLFDSLNELPEMARAVVLSEIFTAPKSLGESS
jgi:hypothetical protein